MKFLIIGVLVGLIACYAVQTRARLTFPDYDKINKIDEFYFWGDFRSLGVRGRTRLLPAAAGSDGTTGSLPICRALLRVRTNGAEYRS